MAGETLAEGIEVAVATRDEWSKTVTYRTEFFEFQMLYGNRPELQKQLVQEGYRVRICVPYGND